MRKKLKILLVFLGIFFLLGSSGCGTKGKSEEEIKEEVSNYIEEELKSKYRVDSSSIENIEITKRSTSKRDKIDDIWLSIKASTETFNITWDSIMVEYQLSDNTWYWNGIYNFDDSSMEYIPVITKEMVDGVLFEEGYTGAVYKNRETDTENGVDTFYYEYVKSGGYLTTVYNLSLSYRHVSLWNEKPQWMLYDDDFTVEVVSREWDVLGKWEYLGDDGYAMVNIVSFDGENKEMEIEYYYEERDEDTGEIKWSFDSEGTIKLTLESYGEWFDTSYIEKQNPDGTFLDSRLTLVLGDKKSTKSDDNGIIFEDFFLLRQQ